MGNWNLFGELVHMRRCNSFWSNIRFVKHFDYKMKLRRLFSVNAYIFGDENGIGWHFNNLTWKWTRLKTIFMYKLKISDSFENLWKSMKSNKCKTINYKKALLFFVWLQKCISAN